MIEYYLFVFDSTHGAIFTEKILKPVGCTVMPTLRAISTSCGIAVRVDSAALGDATRIMNEQDDLSKDEYRLYHVIKNGSDYDCKIINF